MLSKRDFKNFLREQDVSGLVFLGKGLLSLLSTSPIKKLSAISGILRHYPALPGRSKLVHKALSLSASNQLFSAKNSSTLLGNSIILKRYVSASEKGFLLVSFEGELEKILVKDKLSEIEKRYFIIFLPSWTGMFSPALISLASRSNFPFYVMPVHDSEHGACRELGERCRSLPFNAASWVNDKLFSTVARNRDIDCLMVANFAEFKRHWLLFKAMQGLPSSITATCVGVPLGSRTARSLELEAEHYGVGDRVTIIENPSQERLREYFSRAKVFCALSYREGSFIAVAEALIAGTPVIMFSNAHIGTKKLVNSSNGALVRSMRELREKILYFQAYRQNENIKDASRESVSYSASCEKLNSLLKRESLGSGNEWTEDIITIYSVRLQFFYEDKSALSRLENDIDFFSHLGFKIGRGLD